jgi:hypothetical protein
MERLSECSWQASRQWPVILTPDVYNERPARKLPAFYEATALKDSRNVSEKNGNG